MNALNPFPRGGEGPVPPSLGRYSLVAEIASGSTATVYLAEDLRLRRKVAIKMLHPHLLDKADTVRRFETEAVAIAALAHENIIKVFDFGREGRGLFLAMEYVNGISLDQWLPDAAGPLPNLAVVSLFRQILAGLEAAHLRGVYHRDIKPSNVLIDKEGRAVIADFGIAYLVQEPSITRTGAFLGTPGYAAPEQAEGKPISDKTDIFSAGAVLYQCLTGEFAFTGESPHAVLNSILHRHPPKADSVYRKMIPALADLARDMLAKPPQQRPDARACLRRLEELVTALGLDAGSRRIREAVSDPRAARESEDAELSGAFAASARAARATGRHREAMKLYGMAELFAEEGGELAVEVAAHARRSVWRARARIALPACLLLSASAWLLLEGGHDEAPPPSGPDTLLAGMRPPPAAVRIFAAEGAMAEDAYFLPVSMAGPSQIKARAAEAKPVQVAPARKVAPVPKWAVGAETANSGGNKGYIPAPGWLQVKSNPPFARLRLDGMPSGRTPLASALELAAGTHRLELEREGCLPMRAEVIIQPGETTAVRLTLERAQGLAP